MDAQRDEGRMDGQMSDLSDKRNWLYYVAIGLILLLLWCWWRNRKSQTIIVLLPQGSSTGLNSRFFDQNATSNAATSQPVSLEGAQMSNRFTSTGFPIVPSSGIESAESASIGQNILPPMNTLPSMNTPQVSHYKHGYYATTQDIAAHIVKDRGAKNLDGTDLSQDQKYMLQLLCCGTCANYHEKLDKGNWTVECISWSPKKFLLSYDTSKMDWGVKTINP